MTTLHIVPNPDDADPGFNTGGEPVDPEGHTGPARWATVTPIRRRRVPGCPWCDAQPDGPWHDPNPGCLDSRPSTHGSCGRCF